MVLSMKWMFSRQKNSKQFLNSLLIQSKFLNISILKLFKKGLTPLLCALTFFNLCGFSVNAAEIEINVPFVEPSVPEYGGYVNVYGDWGYGNNHRTYVIAFYPYDMYTDFESGSLNGMYGTFYDYFNVSVYTTPTAITFSIVARENYDGLDATGYVNLYRLGNQGSVSVLASAYLSDPNEWYYTDTFTNIIAWQPVGNISVRESSVNTGNSLNVIWGDDKSLINRIDYSNSLLEEILSTLDPDATGSEDTSFVDSTQITDIATKEEELLSENLSTDLENMEISINPNSSAVCWNIIDDVLTSNTKVFSMFLSILAIGIIGLILNR